MAVSWLRSRDSRRDWSRPRLARSTECRPSFVRHTDVVTKKRSKTPKTSAEPGIEAPEREHRWPAAVASVAVLALLATLPVEFTPVVRIVAVVLGAVMLIPLLVLNPKHMNRQTVWSRRLSMAFTVGLLAVNQWFMIELIFKLVSIDSAQSVALLVAALQIWLANLLMFALLYWELDRGGPVSRNTKRRAELPRADLKFTHDTDDHRVDEIGEHASYLSNWRPTFIDYLFGAASFAMAFSPGDAMPMTPRLKVLMLLQSLLSFVMLALVIARAVGIIGELK